MVFQFLLNCVVLFLQVGHQVQGTLLVVLIVIEYRGILESLG